MVNLNRGDPLLSSHGNITDELHLPEIQKALAIQIQCTIVAREKTVLFYWKESSLNKIPLIEIQNIHTQG